MSKMYRRATVWIGLLAILGSLLTTQPSAPSHAQGGELVFGEEISGRLESDEGDRYTFEGEEGDRFYAFMESDSYASYLALFDDSNNRLLEASYNIGDHAFINFYQLPYSGSYTLMARGYRADSRGRYKLTADTVKTSLQTVVMGDEINGQIENAIPHFFGFEAEEGDRLYVSMESEIFPSYIILLDDEGNKLFDTSYDVGDNAYTAYFELPYSGEYLILAHPYHLGNTGRYTFRIDTIQNMVMPIEAGYREQGEIETYFDDFYSFEGEEGDWVLVSMESDAYETYLVLIDDEWNVLQEKSFSVGDNAFVYYSLPYTGEYIIGARPYHFGRLGRYNFYFDMRLNRTQTLVENTVIEGELNSYFPDYYAFEGEEGAILTITHNGENYPTYLELFDEDGNRLLETSYDDGDNAVIREYALPYSGVYFFAAWNYHRDEYGDYTLTFSLE